MSRNPQEASSRPTVALTYRLAEKKVEGLASARGRWRCVHRNSHKRENLNKKDET